MQDYIVFLCSKCHEYIYAKIKQKGKKCTRCGRNHIVAHLHGVIVEGPTKAMQEVKRRQNQLGISYSMGFAKMDEKNMVQNNNNQNLKNESQETEVSDFKVFMRKIYEFQRLNALTKNIGIPEYVLEMLLEDLNFPRHIRKRLINYMKTHHRLKRLNNGNFFLN
jgi:hypothetical protein